MSLAGSKSRLAGITKELQTRWEDTRGSWRDAKAEEFEAKHLRDLFAETDKTLAVIEKLDELLKHVRNDCE